MITGGKSILGTTSWTMVDGRQWLIVVDIGGWEYLSQWGPWWLFHTITIIIWHKNDTTNEGKQCASHGAPADDYSRSPMKGLWQTRRWHGRPESHLRIRLGSGVNSPHVVLSRPRYVQYGTTAFHKSATLVSFVQIQQRNQVSTSEWLSTIPCRAAIMNRFSAFGSFYIPKKYL